MYFFLTRVLIRLLQKDNSMLMCYYLFQLTHMLTWAPVAPVDALAYFSRQYPPHPISAQYAVRVLRNYPPVSIIKYTHISTRTLILVHVHSY